MYRRRDNRKQGRDCQATRNSEIRNQINLELISDPKPFTKTRTILKVSRKLLIACPFNNLLNKNSKRRFTTIATTNDALVQKKLRDVNCTI